MIVRISPGSLRLRVTQREATTLMSAGHLTEMLTISPGLEVELHAEVHDGPSLQWQASAVRWVCRVPKNALATEPFTEVPLPDGGVLRVTFEVDRFDEHRRAARSKSSH